MKDNKLKQLYIALFPCQRGIGRICISDILLEDYDINVLSINEQPTIIGNDTKSIVKKYALNERITIK